MLIRDFRAKNCPPHCSLEHVHGASDIPRIHEIYLEQGFDYMEPDWGKMEGKVLTDDQDLILTYELARKTCEVYAGTDKGEWATPGIKAEQFKRLDAQMVEKLRSEGYEDQHSWIPPQCRAFLRRLIREMGWVRTDGEKGFVGLLRWIG